MTISKDQLQKQEKLNTLIDIMLQGTSSPDDYYEEFIKIYKDPHYRHSYSKITEHILMRYYEGEIQEDSFDFFLEGLDYIYDKLVEDPNAEDDIVKSFFKLRDHLWLEIVRVRYLPQAYGAFDGTSLENSINSARTQLEKTQKEFNDKIEKTEKNIEEANETVTNLHGQMISILGIFAAIVFAFLGGFSTLTGLLSNLQNLGPYKIVFAASIIGFIIFNLIAFLLSCAAYLSGKSIPYTMKYQSDADNSKKDTVKTFYYRVFWFTNIILLVLIVFSAILWLLSNYITLPLNFSEISSLFSKK